MSAAAAAKGAVKARGGGMDPAKQTQLANLAGWLKVRGAALCARE